MGFVSSPISYLKKRKPIYQISTLQSLIMGNYYGSATVEHLLRFGDIGLGMFEAADGELVLLNHRCYRILGDGSARLAAMEDRVTFASVSFVEEGDTIRLGALESLEALRSLLDERVELLGTNYLYIVRVDGAFRRVAARTELRQEPPFQKFAEVIARDERRFVFEYVTGSLVCFYFPQYLEGVNTAGWHFHFLDEACSCGGHVFDMELEQGRALLNRTDRFVMDLPHNPEFQEAALAEASKDEIHQIEQGGDS